MGKAPSWQKRETGRVTRSPSKEGKLRGQGEFSAQRKWRHGRDLAPQGSHNSLWAGWVTLVSATKPLSLLTPEPSLHVSSCFSVGATAGGASLSLSWGAGGLHSLLHPLPTTSSTSKAALKDASSVTMAVRLASFVPQPGLIGRLGWLLQGVAEPPPHNLGASADLPHLSFLAGSPATLAGHWFSTPGISKGSTPTSWLPIRFVHPIASPVVEEEEISRAALDHKQFCKLT